MAKIKKPKAKSVENGSKPSGTVKKNISKGAPVPVEAVNSVNSKKSKLALKKSKKSELKLVTKSIKREGEKKKNKVKPVDRVELINELLKDDKTKVEEVPLQGFKVVKWRLNRNPETIHHLFIKKHEVAINELAKGKPPGRTVLCHNVPSYFNEGHIREIFQTFGSVEKVYIHQTPTSSVPEKVDRLFLVEKDVPKGFRVAYIVYSENKTVKDLMNLDPVDVDPVVVKKPPNAGVQRWINEYNSRIVPKGVLEKEVRKFMDNFDKEELIRKEKEKNANELDDEGWTTVTRTGKRASGGLVRSEKMEQRLKEKKRRQDRQLLNFTPAQIKESKMKQLLELKKKFEEDKQRVALLKQQRKFKPF